MSAICAPNPANMSNWFSYENPGISEAAKILKQANEHISESLQNSGTFLAEMLPLQNAYEEASEEGWDGYDAEKINYATYVNAQKFLSLLPAGIEAPEFTPESDGEISIEWQKSSKRIFSVSVGQDGRLTYVGFYGKSRAKGVEYLDDEIPQNILSNIKRILQ